MSAGHEDGWALDDPPLDVPLLLLVDHQEVVGVQLDGVLYLHALHLQPVHKHLVRTAERNTLNNKDKRRRRSEGDSPEAVGADLETHAAVPRQVVGMYNHRY